MSASISSSVNIIIMLKKYNNVVNRCPFTVTFGNASARTLINKWN